MTRARSASGDGAESGAGAFGLQLRVSTTVVTASIEGWITMRRAANLDGNHGEIVEALLSITGVSVHSLAGVGCGVPDLLVGARGLTFLVEVKNGEKPPSHRTLTPDQTKWIGRWTGSPVVVLLDAGKALSWARSIAAAPSTYVDLFGREEDLNRCHA